MIKTKNIYYAAYLFTEKIAYKGVEVINDIDNQTGVFFSFEESCEGEEDLLQSSYESELAKVNIRKYLDQLMLVRNIMYREIDKIKNRKILKDERTGNKNDYRSIRRKQARPTI